MINPQLAQKFNSVEHLANLPRRMLGRCRPQPCLERHTRAMGFNWDAAPLRQTRVANFSTDLLVELGLDRP
jgi:hypothetical protein